MLLSANIIPAKDDKDTGDDEDASDYEYAGDDLSKICVPFILNCPVECSHGENSVHPSIHVSFYKILV